MNKRSKKKNNSFFKVLSFILLLSVVFAYSVLLYFDVFPSKYLLLSGVLAGIVIIFIMYKLNVKTKVFTKVLCIFLSIFLIFISVLGSVYAIGTIDFFNNIFDTGYKVETYGLYTFKSSTIKDLNDKKIGVKIGDNEESLPNALKKLSYKVKYEKEEFDSITEAVNSLESSKIDGLLINESIMDIYLEEHDVNLIKIDSFDVVFKHNSEFKEVNVVKKPFVIYLSGVDTSGSVNKSARSDVNLLAIVNPSSGKILLVNTPRDYYLTLYSKNAKDKLTHAGLYGIDESAKSLGLLYETDVNYYARINFTSFIKIIDNLGGITLDVEKPNYRYNGSHDCGYGYICEQNSKRLWDNNTIYIKPGQNVKLNGEQALAYARNRHQYASGDNARGRHQQQIVKAIIEKIVSPSVITKYNTILKDLSKGIITNVDQKDITKLINYQLDNNIKWSIETINAKGRDSFEQVYSLGKAKAYVLVPLDESVDEIKEKIKEVIGE